MRTVKECDNKCFILHMFFDGIKVIFHAYLNPGLQDLFISC